MTDRGSRQSQDSSASSAVSGRAFITVSESDGDHIAMSKDELVEVLGISALCCFNTKGTELFKLLAISAQGFALQIIVLYFLARQLNPRDDPDEPKAVSRVIIGVAVYLHLINCAKDIPFGLTTLYHFNELKDTVYERLIAGPCLFIDCVLVPIATVVIGALYLCTSQSVSDVITNSCGVAFITSIDNWILGINVTISRLSGDESGDARLHIPHAGWRAHTVNWVMVYIPFVPAILSYAIMYLGLDVMRL